MNSFVGQETEKMTARNWRERSDNGRKEESDQCLIKRGQRSQLLVREWHFVGTPRVYLNEILVGWGIIIRVLQEVSGLPPDPVANCELFYDCANCRPIEIGRAHV